MSFDTLTRLLPPGRRPTHAVRAPGRVNLIGEHTDYNDGFMLPIAVPMQTRVSAARRSDQQVRAWSRDVPGADQLMAFGIGMERRRAAWVDYLQGVTRSLLDAGHAITGFDVTVESDVPLGSGLSSSASLEVAVLRAIDALFGLGLDGRTIAALAHRAETAFVGVPVGVMDQMACSLATEDAALFIDARSLDFARVPLPASVELLVLDSGLTHAHAGGEYRLRRQECEAAAAALGVASLRDADARLLTGRPLPSPLDRRARHVVTENERVLEMRMALVADNVPAAGALMNASHRSMSEDFEVSTPDIDVLAVLAQNQEGIAGARLTGGGFGGCVVALCARGYARSIGPAIVGRYSERTGRSGRVLVPGA